METLARTDLPIRIGSDASVVLPATIDTVDQEWGLTQVCFPGGALWLRDMGLPVGRRIRVRVFARDVSLTCQQPSQTSILNVLPGTVDAFGEDEHPGLVLVRVRIGASLLLARLTRRAVKELDLVPGDAVWKQVKTVAVME